MRAHIIRTVETKDTNMTTTKKNTMVNSDPMAPVRMENIKIDGEPSDKYYVAMQKEASEEYTDIPGVGSVHSADYQLVTNEDVRNLAVDVMAETGLHFEPLPHYEGGKPTTLFWNGHRYMQRWFSRDVSIQAPNGRGLFAMGLQIQNSYGGSSAVSFEFFGMHLLCANQFYSANLFGSARFPHVTSKGGNIALDRDWAKDKILAQAESFSTVQPKMQLLQETRVGGMREFLDLRKQLHAETGVNTRDKQWLDELSGQGVSEELGIPMDNYEDPETFWALASAYTAVTTHCVGGPVAVTQSSSVVDWLVNKATPVEGEAVLV